ncbi:RBBP9/YdeN family alpha/beta hydrolase [Microbacterium trichothecenolyticum]|uniref:RBBP9/YdeN family alpha/beta hydrolase n=1 Tax=Microbacterium trichothecenolyticum TaxID=69370 RepID=UPI0027D90A73|nr:alpha/beta hydrolase [Microbacterium trichothecenolyticum]
MVAYVVVPGIGGSDGQHWQSRWEHGWGADAVRITPSSWDAPDLDDWVDAVDRAVRDARGRADQVVVVAHSLGCWATTVWVRGDAEHRVAAVMLVAPPDLRDEGFPATAAASFVDLEPRTLSCRSVVVASTDDPHCRVDVAQGLAAGWGSPLRVVGARGHLNSASGLGEWAEGREVLAGLVRE